MRLCRKRWEFSLGRVGARRTVRRTGRAAGIRLQSPTIRKFKRGRISGTECIRRRKSDDFSGSDILEISTGSTDFILIFCLSFTNGLYGSSTDTRRPACPPDLTSLSVTLPELRGFRRGIYCNSHIILFESGMNQALHTI